MAVKKRKNTRRKVPAERGLFSGIDIRSVIYAVFLISFFCFTIGVLVYVVFFRTVVSNEQALFIGQVVSNMAG